MPRRRAVSADLTVIVLGEAVPLANELERQIQAVWKQEVARRPGLFEGSTFVPEKLVEDANGLIVRIEGRFIPYSRYIAARADPSLATTLDQWVMGASGVLRSTDGIVVGRRSPAVTDGGSLELVPSCTIGLETAKDADQIDLRGLILQELREELGLHAGDLDSGPTPFIYVEDVGLRIADVGFLMTTTLNRAMILSAYAALEDPEYDQLLVLGARDCDPAALREAGILTTSLELLNGLTQIQSST